MQGGFLFVCLFLRLSLSVSPRLEFRDTISADCNLCFPSSGKSRDSASQVTEIIGVHRHARLIFVILVDSGLHHVGQADLELGTSGDLPALASQSARITAVSHHTRLQCFFYST